MNTEIRGEDERFLNFPIKMMQGVLSGRKDKKEFLKEVLYYCLYRHSEKIKDAEIEYDETDLERLKRTQIISM